jgi:hypothetical protein
MKKFLAIIMLMGHVKEDTTRVYWNISKLIETPVFGKLMSRNRFEQIWTFGTTVASPPWMMKEIDYITSGQF